MMNKLTTTEKTRLDECELVIKKGLQTFVEVGSALLEIRESRLYRIEYGTFEEYCRERWGMAYRHSNRLIQSAEVIANLGPIGPIPASESQTRPLTKLQPEQQKEVWQAITEKYEPEEITAKVIEGEISHLIPESQLLKIAKEANERRKQEAIQRREERINQEAQKPLTDEENRLLKAAQNGETVVINMNQHFAVLKWAKENGKYQQIDRFSEWGNPFYLGPDGDRDHVCDAYERYLKDKKSLHPKIGNLKGKVLGCHCHPMRCHGDGLKKLADETN